MNTEIVVALISLAGIIITAIITKNAFMHELDKQIALLQSRLVSVEQKLILHNGYAEKFGDITTDIRLIQQDISYIKNNNGIK